MLDRIINRPDFDNYFMSLAFLASTRSADPSTKVGAVVVFDDLSFVTGYNGFPRGFNDGLLKDRSLKHKFVLHAEENALDFAGLDRCRQNENLRLYVTFKPCVKCAVKIINFNVKEVIYRNVYQSDVCSDDALLNLIINNGYNGINLPLEEEEPILKIRKYDGELMFEHNHMGIKNTT